MKTTRSLAQSLSKFCANSFRVAADCNDPPLRELLMVSLQSTLLHNCHLKMITASKAVRALLSLFGAMQYHSSSLLCEQIASSVVC